MEAAFAAPLNAAPAQRLGSQPTRTLPQPLGSQGGARSSQLALKAVAEESPAAGESSNKGAFVAWAAAAACGGRAALRRVRRQRAGRGGRSLSVVRPAGSGALPPTAPTIARPVSATVLFKDFFQSSRLAARVLAGLPVPPVLLSSYTALPAFSLAAAQLTPGSQLARGLAGALGLVIGSATGAFLKTAKKDAATAAIAQLLAQHMASEAVSVEELRSLVQAQRKRFGVPADSKASEQWEDGALIELYEALLNNLLNGPEHDAGDLPALQRLKAALELDGIVVGNAHRHAAQLLVSRGYSGLEGEPMRVATDKLLFLSERAFSDEGPEEAGVYEMGRLCQVLNIAEREARERVAAVSKALYQQSLSAVADKVDAHTAEALAGAKLAFGVAGEEAERMNTETYKQIAADQLAGGRLAAQGKVTLERARGVLQLGERAATASFVAVASPILLKDVEALATRIQGGATAAENLKEAAASLVTRRDELGLSASAAFSCVEDGFMATMRSLYSLACKDARNKNSTQALPMLDKLVSFASAAELVLMNLPVEAGSSPAPFTMTADPLPARRLYSIFLERNLAGEGPANAAQPADLARVLELSEADEEVARIEICQPRLLELYQGCIDTSEASGTPLSQVKADVSAQLSKFRLPAENVQKTTLDVYKSRLAKVTGRVLKSTEKEALDAARSFLDLDRSKVRLLHIKAFADTYQSSVEEAMGRDGVMQPEVQEALYQLQERLGLEDEDARQIYLGVIEARLKKLMVPVRDAWEEATYTKESLMQLNKERGRDIGDDPLADGSGGLLGIQDSPTVDGIRGARLMTEFCSVVEFYLINKVLKKDESGKAEDEYPVTVGKWLDEKSKEEMYGIFAWNAVTCQEAASKDQWERAKPHVGGILGMSKKQQEKVLVRMVSRWANTFIKNKIADQGALSTEDISTLTDWVPMFFGIDKDVTKDMVQSTNKGIIQNKVLRLLNKPSVTPDDINSLRAEVDSWDLEIKKDLELSKPQLKGLFRVECAGVLE
ncbi:unnamed protein product, partial [Polarella glacialis]